MAVMRSMMIAKNESIHQAAVSVYELFKSEYNIDSDISVIRDVIADNISQFFDDIGDDDITMDD